MHLFFGVFYSLLQILCNEKDAIQYVYIYIYTYAKGGSSNANVLNFVCCLKQAAQFECECQADAKV